MSESFESQDRICLIAGVLGQSVPFKDELDSNPCLLIIKGKSGKRDTLQFLLRRYWTREKNSATGPLRSQAHTPATTGVFVLKSMKPKGRSFDCRNSSLINHRNGIMRLNAPQPRHKPSYPRPLWLSGGGLGIARRSTDRY